MATGESLLDEIPQEDDEELSGESEAFNNMSSPLVCGK